MVSRLTVNQLLLVRIQLGTQMSSLKYCNSKLRVSYNGHYSFLPSRRCRFDSYYSLYITDLWCNGNTTVFGAVILGSSPNRSSNSRLTQLVECLFYMEEVIGSSPISTTM